MLLQRIRLHRTLNVVADALLAGAALIVAVILRNVLFHDNYPISLMLPLVGPVMVIAPVLLQWFSFYSQSENYHRWQLLSIIMRVSVLTLLVVVLLAFLLKLDLNRPSLLIFVPIMTLFIFSRVIALRLLRSRLHLADMPGRGIVLVTDHPASNIWRDQIQNNPQLGFRLVKEVPFENFSVESLIELMHANSVEIVIFDVRHGDIKRVSDGIKACEEEGVEAWLAADFLPTSIARARVDTFRERPLLIFRSTPDSSIQLLAKECMDRVGAAIALIMLLPIFVLIAVLIKLTSPGPVIFKQARSGRYGRRFIMYKFRSMVSDAETRREEFEKLNEMSGPVFKVKDDPRVTPLGRWLRATSLDELPQLWNVLRGEMSLVGPRPLPEYETRAISINAQRRRLSVKPGLTCLWQVQGRSQVKDFAEWVRLDLEYIDHWSIWLDMKILWLTIPAVLRRRGAM